MSSLIDLDKYDFHRIFNSIPTSLIVVDTAGRIVYLNNQTEKLFGYYNSCLLGEDITILIPARYRKKHKHYQKEFNNSPSARPMGAGRDLFALKRNGEEIPVEIALTPLDKEQYRYVIITIIDISYRKQIERNLRENEEKLQSIIDNSADAIFVFDLKGDILSSNREAHKLFGEKQNIESIWEIFPESKRKGFSEMLQNVRDGKKITDRESEIVLPGGRTNPVSFSMFFIEENGGMYVQTIRDITERVRFRNRIVEYEKNKIIATMSEGIAHHMGTPLASMLLRVQMLKEDLLNENRDPGYIEKLESVEKQIHYGQKIMQRMLKFSSSSSDEKKRVSLSALANDILEITLPIRKSLEIDMINSVNENIYVFADKDMIELVISDLVMNSIDAMPSGGEIVVDAHLQTTDPESVMVEIRDTGTGIPRDVLPHIFEPFYTTKPAGKGTGLGLSVARNIIHNHDGEINIESIFEKGTVVKIKLPAA